MIDTLRYLASPVAAGYCANPWTGNEWLLCDSYCHFPPQCGVCHERYHAILNNRSGIASKHVPFLTPNVRCQYSYSQIHTWTAIYVTVRQKGGRSTRRHLDSMLIKQSVSRLVLYGNAGRL